MIDYNTINFRRQDCMQRRKPMAPKQGQAELNDSREEIKVDPTAVNQSKFIQRVMILFIRLLPSASAVLII